MGQTIRNTLRSLIINAMKLVAIFWIEFFFKGMFIAKLRLKLLSLKLCPSII